MTIRYVNECKVIAFGYMAIQLYIEYVRVISIDEKVYFDLF